MAPAFSGLSECSALVSFKLLPSIVPIEFFVLLSLREDVTEESPDVLVLELTLFDEAAVGCLFWVALLIALFF